ncbi:MAG TPA: NAD(P)/FAD-dependent oxidoreductase [Thermoanaerobaculia bacterium]|nr:NAD(P)/FAD-dependent oxidoreductase [Thermoanaerobaculia bacterium]
MFDVIIIGAGAAGLAVARELAGHRIAILEARDRIGGRIHTLHPADLALPIELGAEFIHGDAEATFNVVDNAALLAYELPDDHWWSDDGAWKEIDFWEDLDRLFAKIGKREQSFDAFLRTQRVDARLRELACGFVEGFHAAHANLIDARAVEALDDMHQYRIASGYDSLIAWLRAGVADLHALRLGTTVSEIRWKRGGVEVVTNKETLRARAAIITVPLGVLKAGSIRFTPELKEKQHAIDRLEVGHVVKIVFRFREPFWKPHINFVHSIDRFMPTWWTCAPARAPLLTGWCGGHAADALAAESDPVDRALDSMARIFGTRRSTIDRLLIGTFTHDWQHDPFSRGAYSYSGVGGIDAQKELAKPLQSTLFFAGEATNGEQTGTVAGAIVSGQRAAKQVRRIISPAHSPSARRSPRGRPSSSSR